MWLYMFTKVIVSNQLFGGGSVFYYTWWRQWDPVNLDFDLELFLETTVLFQITSVNFYFQQTDIWRLQNDLSWLK